MDMAETVDRMGVANATANATENAEQEKAEAERVEAALEFSEVSLELSLKKGEVKEGAFTVFAPEGTLVKGGLYLRGWKWNASWRNL